MNPVTTGGFAPGNRITPLRDLVEYKDRILESEFGEPYPMFGTNYLIEESFEHIPQYLDYIQRQRWLFYAKPYHTQIKIKIFGFTMKCDKHGFDIMFKSNLFRPV